jgi:hypothetical protein
MMPKESALHYLERWKMANIKFPYMHFDHPEDERYDEINIRCIPRWKESELSGDEWRFSYVAEVKRKGEVVMEIGASKLEWLLQGLQWRMLIAGEEDKVDRDAWERTKDKCDQPSCPNVATIFYVRKKRYTSRGEELAPDGYHDGKTYRQFCEGHKHRGDCDLDDADANYIEITKEALNG